MHVEKTISGENKSFMLIKYHHPNFLNEFSNMKLSVMLINSSNQRQ